MRGVLIGLLPLAGCVFITDADRQLRADLLAAADTTHTGSVSVGDDDDDDDDDGPEPATLPGAYLAVDVGPWASCAIDDRRQVECWGDDVDAWWPEVPTDLDAVGISVGLAHGCAWDAQGVTRCFGPAGGSANNPTPGIVERPAGAFDRVSCGPTVCCGLDGGDMACWGEEEGVSPSLGAEPVSTLSELSIWGGGCTVDDADGIDCFSFTSTGGADPDEPYDTDSEWVQLNDGGWACARRAGASVYGCWDLARTGFIELMDVPGTATLLHPVALNNGGTPYLCALVGGQVDCYGTITQGDPPTPPAPAGNWAQLSMTAESGCVIDGVGAMSCWGEGSARPR